MYFTQALGQIDQGRVFMALFFCSVDLFFSFLMVITFGLVSLPKFFLFALFVGYEAYKFNPPLRSGVAEAKARKYTFIMSGQGSLENVTAAISSMVFPGFGQLFQGRIISALFYFSLFIFLVGLMFIVDIGTAALF